MVRESTLQLPTRFGFLLVNDFTLISMSSAIETLRMANRVCGTEIYQWRLISADGGPVRASDGVSVNVQSSLADEALLQEVDAVVVCGGNRIEVNTTDEVLQWLHAANQRRLALGATCTGSVVLAMAGLLDGYRCSVHWENIASMTARFPAVRVGSSIYTIDRDRYTSSGGTTPIDMMLYFVRRHCGADVSAGVAEQFVYERIRSAADDQRVPLRHIRGNLSGKLVSAVELMEANIKEPISQVELAAYVNLSPRQLQRLFLKYLLCSPARYYLQLRLQRARELLQQTSMSLVEIASHTGFISSSHFSRAYKGFYGHSPRVERRQLERARAG